ncbi:MAG TPA: alginate export family protein [Melioribacteraceae bacterium]|nr:alginate export family protein [Melioribacteraceae bacterium]
MKKFLSLTLLFLSGSILTAQESIKISAQIRPRIEIEDKDFNSSTRLSTQTLFRTRLGLSFAPSGSVSGFIQLQDSRKFGEESATIANMKNVDLHQAYFKLDQLFDLPFSLKAGRFEALYGSQRFFGNNNWNNIARSFDGGILGYSSSKITIDLFVFREYERSLPGDSTDYNVYALITDLDVIESNKIQTYFIFQRAQPTTLLNRATVGINIKGNIDRFNHEIDFAYQTGSFYSGGRDQSISAYTFSVNAGYRSWSPLKPAVNLQLDLVSGDDSPGDNTFKSFTSLYGGRHKFFGYMDYFVSFPNDTYGLGLIDLIGKLSVSPIQNLTLNIHAHLFSSMHEYILNSGTGSNSFGSEVDVVAAYKYSDHVSFEGGASMFFPGDIFKEKRGKDNSSWFYIMAVVNF